jgi:transcriptional regulator with XRE-family HTH domain
MSREKYRNGKIFLGERLKQFRLAQGMKANQFAEVVGISQSSLSEIENQNTNPSAETLSLVVRNTNINSLWLLTGEGAMFREKNEGRPLSTINTDCMSDVIEAVEEIFQKEKYHLSPKKKAELIMLLYEELMDKEFNKSSIFGKVIKLVRLAS